MTTPRIIEGLKAVVADRRHKMLKSVQCHRAIGMDTPGDVQAKHLLEHAKDIVATVNEYKDAARELGEAEDFLARSQRGTT